MEKSMIFYDIMWYNHPQDKEYFQIHDSISNYIKYKPKKEKKLSEDVKPYEDFLNKYSYLRKHIPFVKAIYVSNSITFKSVHENTDIDLFIICAKWHIWQAKLWGSLIPLLFGLRRTTQDKKMKICQWFWITENHLDLYPISIWLDIYLAYWIAHLQPLYIEDDANINNIFQKNTWVKEIIPNYSLTYKPILQLNLTTWKGRYKKFIEFIFRFFFIDSLLWLVRWSIMRYKNKKKKFTDIIISDNMLKFVHPDIRNKVYLQYKILKNESQRKNRNIKERALQDIWKPKDRT
jgi:hypothetical protein